MQVTVRFELPRDAVTIPILRRLCGRSLEVVGADDEVISDVELALREYCRGGAEQSTAGDIMRRRRTCSRNSSLTVRRIRILV